ncbi:MAG: hypothetical protein LBK75_00745 [Oscillospiraceae bacterium]|nr:hypothetical protein [Oscillospiraceae bacterium]
MLLGTGGWTFGFQGKVESSGNDTVVRLPDSSVISFKAGANGTFTAKDSRTTLVKNSNNTYKLTTKDQYSYDFNTAGYLVKMNDPNGNAITVTVDSTGRPTSVQDQSGRTATIAYTGSYISSITDAANRQVVYSYTSNRLSSVKDPSGYYTYYTYDTNGYLASVKDHNQNTIESFTHEVVGQETLKKLKTMTTAYSNTTTYKYDWVEGSVRTQDSNGRTETTYFDKALYPIRVIDAGGRQSRITYHLDNGINRWGERASETDRNGNTTYYEYDTRGNVTKVVNPDMGFRTYTYDSKNNVTKEVDEEGQTTYYQYDTKGNMTLKARRKAGTQDYSSSATQSNFAISKYTYNSQGFMTAALPAGYSTTSTGSYPYLYSYNAYGQRTMQTTDFIQGTTYGQRIITEYLSYVRTNYTYNTVGMLTNTSVMKYGWALEYFFSDGPESGTFAEDTEVYSTTDYYYDKNGRLLKIIYTDGSVDRTIYDYQGNITKQISPKYYSTSSDSAVFDAQHIMSNNGSYTATVNTTRYLYAGNGILASETNPLGYVTTYTVYNLYGNLMQKTMPNGAVYLYEYDSLDRLTKESFKETSNASASTLFTYTYGISGGKTLQTEKRYLTSSSTASTVYTYDWAGRLLTKQNPTGGGTFANGYYKNGLLKTAEDARGYIALYKYDPLGRMTERRAPTVNNTTYALTKWTYSDINDQVASELRYIENQTSASETGTSVATNYTYSTLKGWLTAQTDSSGRSISYSYDAYGNLIRENISNKRTEYTYNNMNRVIKKTEYLQTKDTTAGSTSTSNVSLETVYTYDLNGNLLTEKNPNNITTTYTYDAMNRQTGVSYPNYNESNSSVTVTTSQTYNNMGLVSTQTDERGKVTSLSYDKRGRLLSTTYPDGGIAAYAYDVGGRIIAQVSPGNYESGKTADQMSYQTVYTYDAMDRVKTTGFKKTTTTTLETLTYDNAGNVLTRKNAMNNTTSYTYDAANRLVTTTHPSSLGTNTNAYDALGRVTQTTNEKGVVSQYTYDDADNLLTQSVATTAGAVTVLTNTYDKLGNVLTSTDANGSVTTNTYNEMGWLRTTTLPEDDSVPANTVTYCYDKVGNIANTRDGLSREQICTYDNMGRVRTAKEQQVGGTQAIITSTRYDKAGNPVYVYDGRNNMTTYTYDNRNRVLTVKNPKNQTTTYTYDLNGNKLSETDWRGNKYEYVYDERDRLTEKRDPFKSTANPQGNLIELLEYDNNDRQIKSTDALGHSKTFTYDARGRLLSTTEPLTSTVSYTTSQTYDGVGNVLTKTDGNGKATRFQYDERNRLTTVKDHNNVLLSAYTYDNAGNLLAQVDSEARVTPYSYNARNLPVTRRDPEIPSIHLLEGVDVDGTAKTVSFTYRADGTVATETDRSGVTTIFAYDIHGRTLSKTAGGSTISYTYDANANLLTMTDGTGTTTRTYDALNRVLTKTAPNTGTITYTYDVTSGMATGTWGEQSVDTKGNTVVKVYDQAGRLSQVKHASQTTTYAYLDNGALQKVTYPGGAYEEYTYYDDNKLHTLTNKKANGSILDAYNYAYDGAGNRTQILDGHGTTTYTYDVLNRLLTATEPDGRVTAYTYDGSGNRTSETITQSGQSTVTTYQYNEQNRLTATETEQPDDIVRLVDFYYDNNGNMVGRTSALLTDSTSAAVLSLSETEDEAALYDYDVWNNMISSTVDGETTTHTYNGDGLRVSKTANGLTTRYAYEYTEVVLELDGSGNQKALNVRGHKLLSRVTSAGSSWFMYNGHGDVTALVDGANTVQATYYYDAFGVHKEQTGTANNPYRYNGYTFDEESGLYYLKSRFYDPELARFMQEDTYRGDPVDPLSLNLYTYVSNNPLVYWDPTGHWSVTGEPDNDWVPDRHLAYGIQMRLIALTSAYYAAETDAERQRISEESDKLRKSKNNLQTASNSQGYSQGLIDMLERLEERYADLWDEHAIGKRSGSNVTAVEWFNIVLPYAGITWEPGNVSNGWEISLAFNNKDTTATATVTRNKSTNTVSVSSRFHSPQSSPGKSPGTSTPTTPSLTLPPWTGLQTPLQTTNPPNFRPPTTKLGTDYVLRILNDIGWQNASRSMAEELAEILELYGITTKESIALFLATCAHESDYGSLILENGTDTYFAGKKYGKNARGVGYIQLTWPENHLEFLRYKGDSYSGQETAQHIYENYNPWEISAYTWTIVEHPSVLNDYVNQYGVGENVFLVTQYYINGWLDGGGDDLSAIRKGTPYEIKNGRLYVNGHDYRLPNGWENRMKVYDNVMKNYYNK